MTFFNETGTIGQIFNGFNNDVTGSVALTVAFIIICLVLIGMVFRLPMGILMIFITPIFMAILVYFSADLKIWAILGLLAGGLILAFQIINLISNRG